MTQRIESSISEDKKNSFRITDFIFHIIDVENQHENDGVVYLDEIILNERQEQFFLDRIRDATSGTQYLFTSSLVPLKSQIDNLESTEHTLTFNEFSQNVTANFATHHSGNMSSGIFVVCKVEYNLSENELGKFIFLVKMDKQSSFKYSFIERDGRRIARIDENENSLGERKDTIQKSALIDVSNQFAWHLLAYDRTKKPDLSDYFKEFLSVNPRLTDTVLTQLTHRTVRRWAKTLPLEFLADGEDANTLAGRSLNYLNDNVEFDTDRFIENVIRDDDPARRQRAASSLRNTLVEAGIAGQSFAIKPRAITFKDRKQVYLTEEGVTIYYEGPADAANIVVNSLENGSATITIRTNKLTIK
ncbi:nucleoid-associated protein [Aeromonas hydrophila]|uniref:nucleoid-associated protein n=1 Tax=Aeromonas TaxID=642 RepID=UPI003986A34D